MRIQVIIGAAMGIPPWGWLDGTLGQIGLVVQLVGMCIVLLECYLISKK